MKEMIGDKLDLKDKKILYQLDLNARQSNAEIAKKTRLSKDVANYRIKRLEEKGFIKGYYTIIDFSKLGYFSIRTYLKLFDCTAEKEEEILDFLTKNKITFYVAKIDGSFDLAFSTLTKDIYGYEEFYLEFKKRFKEYIIKNKTSIFTKVHHLHRGYILDKKIDDVPPETFGREKEITHDKLDINILRELAKNARIRTIELAKKLNTPARTVAFRIKRLEKKKIIQGYRCMFNFALLGYKYYKIDFNLKTISRLKELIQYAYYDPHIIYIDETIGGADFEIDVEVKSEEDFFKLINTLRKKFSEIRNWDFFTLRAYNKLIYFPED